MTIRLIQKKMVNAVSITSLNNRQIGHDGHILIDHENRLRRLPIGGWLIGGWLIGGWLAKAGGEFCRNRQGIMVKACGKTGLGEHFGHRLACHISGSPGRIGAAAKPANRRIKTTNPIGQASRKIGKCLPTGIMVMASKISTFNRANAFIKKPLDRWW